MISLIAVTLMTIVCAVGWITGLMPQVEPGRLVFVGGVLFVIWWLLKEWVEDN